MSDPLFLGVEIGGTKLQLGLGRGDGAILALRRFVVDPVRGAEGIREQIAIGLDPLLGDLRSSRNDLAAMGIGFGGPVDSERGIVTVSNQIRGWAGFALGDWVREALGIDRVSIHNDADTAAVAEARFGGGIGCSPLLYVTIGSGIGGGLVVDGKIYRGAGLGAVEIGHLRVFSTCTEDRRKSLRPQELERVASGWSIAEFARSCLVDRTGGRVRNEATEPGLLENLGGIEYADLTARRVAEAASLGDTLAKHVLHRATDAVAQALGHAVTLLNPRRIILGGGVSLIGEELWFEPIRQALKDYVYAPFLGSFDLVPASLGEEVVVHGALALARDLNGYGRPSCVTNENA